MNAPTVSVIMPVYNAERYVAEAVESILAQTFTDFEFLIVDDGSTDGSRKILERYAAQDPRIHLKSRPNTGLVIALNEMLSDARGEFIARMDADDVSLPERFEKQLEFLSEHPKVVAVGTAQVWIDPVGLPLRENVPPREHAEIERIQFETAEACLCHPSAMLRRSAVQAAGNYDESLFGAEDLDLWFRLGEIGLLANMPECLIQYRFHFSKVGFSHKDTQVAAGRRSVENAAARRSVPLIAPNGRGDREVQSVESQYLIWTWWALNAGNVSTARKYALRSLLANPFRGIVWKAVACALRGH